MNPIIELIFGGCAEVRRAPSSTWHSGHRPAIGCLACGGRSPSCHRRSCGRERQDGDRRHLAAVGVRRSERSRHRRVGSAHSTRRLTGALRRSSRRQPPSFNLSDLRSHGRCRLRRWVHAVSDGRRRQRLRNRRGRGRVLGTLPGLRTTFPHGRLARGQGGQAARSPTSQRNTKNTTQQK